MGIRIEARGADRISKEFAQMPAALQRRFTIAMRASLRDVQEEARHHHRFTTRTGEAERSIEVSDVRATAATVSGEVGTTRLITVYLHQGWRAHTIVPRHKLALRWVSKHGGFVFARRARIPARKEDPFIYNAMDSQEEKIVSRFDKAIEG